MTEFFTERTDRGIGACGFAGHDNAHSIAYCSNRVGIGVGRFDRPMNAAEKIDLIRGLQHVLEQPNGLRRASGELEDLIGRCIPAIRTTGDHRRRGIARGMRDRQCRPGSREVRIRRSKGAVRLQRLLYQRIEAAVIVQTPPGIGRRGRRLGLRIH